EPGQVRRLSVAVVVDGTYKKGKDGKEIYVPRTPEEMAKIKDLVRSAINFDPSRGDTMQVVNMQFAQPDAGTAASSSSSLLMGIPRADIFHGVETIILALIGLLVVLLVVRPILRKILETAGNVSEQALLSGGYAAAGVGGAGGGMAQLPSPGGGSVADEMAAEAAAAEAEFEKMIDISRVEGRVKASSLRKVGEIVDKHPDEAISILRNWMYQESR
ncbi:MAG: flagellar M-ring protein FliF, partial [Alphaproteobacteria bacterium]|nr:flagellar M-ring protein FliF [Alphaproteobacteria bacterium]